MTNIEREVLVIPAGMKPVLVSTPAGAGSIGPGMKQVLVTPAGSVDSDMKQVLVTPAGSVGSDMKQVLVTPAGSVGSDMKQVLVTPAGSSGRGQPLQIEMECLGTATHCIRNDEYD